MRVWRSSSGSIGRAMTTGGNCSARSTGSKKVPRRIYGGLRIRRSRPATGRWGLSGLPVGRRDGAGGVLGGGGGAGGEGGGAGGGGKGNPPPPPPKGERVFGVFCVTKNKIP